MTVWQRTRLALIDGTSAMQFWKVERLLGIVGRFAGLGSLIVRSLKRAVSIWNAIRNTSSLLLLGGGRRCRKQRFDAVDARLNPRLS